MTEGTCEKALLQVLIDKGNFIYSEDSLLYRQIFHKRRIDYSLVEMINLLESSEKIIIIRVADKLEDNFIIPDEVSDRIISVQKVLTKPEFEMLYILHLGKFKDYVKVKSKMKPCDYLHQIYPNYEKKYNFTYDYFNKLSSDEILQILNLYSQKRGKCHNKNDLCLLNLFKR